MAVLSDPIADFLTRVKNAGVARNEGFTAPYSGIKDIDGPIHISNVKKES